MPDDAPQNAFELGMEGLRQKGSAPSAAGRAPTPAQREAIAEARRIADARLAEREILHASKMRGILEPEAREALEREYRRDREHIISDRDRKIEDARRGSK